MNFLSETGRLELYLFTSLSPSKQAKLLAMITGYQILPPLWSLGYHYSRWDTSISADKVIQWDSEFSQARIPVDSFWLDIDYTNGYRSFEYDEKKFPDNK